MRNVYIEGDSAAIMYLVCTMKTKQPCKQEGCFVFMVQARESRLTVVITGEDTVVIVASIRADRR